jgi:hypothetical protein
MSLPPVRGGRDIEDRERRVLGRRASAGKDELPGEMVERGPEVVEAVPDNRGERGINRGDFPEPVDVVKSVKVNLMAQGPAVGVADPRVLVVDGCEVHECTVKLGLHACGDVHAGTLPVMPWEPTQTTPEGEDRDDAGLPGEGGLEIPVPKKDDVMNALRKAARASDENNAEA